jgi:hypothetical protein
MKQLKQSKERALYVVDVCEMSFNEIIMEFYSERGKRFPVVLIDELKSRVPENVDLLLWIKKQIGNGDPPRRVSFKPQQEIYDAFGVKR